MGTGFLFGVLKLDSSDAQLYEYTKIFLILYIQKMTLCHVNYILRKLLLKKILRLTIGFTHEEIIGDFNKGSLCKMAEGKTSLGDKGKRGMEMAI